MPNGTSDLRSAIGAVLVLVLALIFAFALLSQR
jgi:hypothetical protein